MLFLGTGIYFFMIKNIEIPITKWKGLIASATKVSVTVVHINLTWILLQYPSEFAAHFFPTGRACVSFV